MKPEIRRFTEAFKRLPRPLPCFNDGAFCPWCGAFHTTLTFGENQCDNCRGSFCFGYPEWGSIIPDRPETFVPFPHREWEAVGEQPHLVGTYVDTPRLRDAHLQVEEYLMEVKHGPAKGVQ